MKPSMAIKPLVFAIAAVLAVAAQAGQNDRRGHHNGHHNGHHTPPPTRIYTDATATAHDRQSSTGNRIYNEGTENSAEMSSSASGASGNVGVNVAAGAGNQQDNAAAIANAGSTSSLDNSFVFGNADASARVTSSKRAPSIHRLLRRHHQWAWPHHTGRTRRPGKREHRTLLAWRLGSLVRTSLRLGIPLNQAQGARIANATGSAKSQRRRVSQCGWCYDWANARGSGQSGAGRGNRMPCDSGWSDCAAGRCHGPHEHPTEAGLP